MFKGVSFTVVKKMGGHHYSLFCTSLTCAAPLPWKGVVTLRSTNHIWGPGAHPDHSDNLWLTYHTATARSLRILSYAQRLRLSTLKAGNSKL